MKKIKLFLPVLFLFLLAASLLGQKQEPPEGGQPKDFVLPAKTVYSLENGMAVTLVPYGKLPKVTVQLRLRAGNKNEAADEVWLADLTTELLKEGTTSRSASQIAEEAASMGGEVGVNVGLDVSRVTGEVLTEFGPQLVNLMADIVQNPVFPESELDRLKKDFLRNLSIAKTRPQQLASEKFAKVLYGDHPYGRIFPTEEMLNSYTIEQVKNFYLANFGAKRAHLYVAGKFDESKVKQAIQQAFAGWAAGPDPVKNIPQPKSVRAVYLVDRPGAPQSTIYMGLPVVDPSHPDFVPLQVMNTLLGGYFSSRITANIREDKGYTYSPRSGITSHYRDAFWRQQADVTTAVTGAALKEIFYEIHRLQKEAPPADELKAVQNYLAGTFVLRNSSPAGIIGQIAFLDFHGLPESYLSDYVKNVHAVTPEQVREMAGKYLQDKSMTVVVVGDSKKIKRELKPFGRLMK